MNEQPPLLPGLSAPSGSRSGRARTLLAVALLTPIILGGFLLFVVKVTGILHAFTVPTDSMAPAICRGDHFYVEAFFYRVASPRRGDAVTFKTDGLPIYDPHAFYVKRLVGLPGDRLRLTNGVLFINDQPSVLRNKDGDIHYTTMLHAKYLADDSDTLIVPPGQYFVLGDNSANSMDSRHFGCVSVAAITGRAIFCYWPLKHLGVIR